MPWSWAVAPWVPTSPLCWPAAATIYPSLCNSAEPARTLREHVAAGRLGLKVEEGFYKWPEGARQQEQQRYASMLQRGLQLLSEELPGKTS